MRKSSLRQLLPRSSAITLVQTMESSALQGWGETPSSQNSGGSTRVPAMNAFTPAA